MRARLPAFPDASGLPGSGPELHARRSPSAVWDSPEYRVRIHATERPVPFLRPPARLDEGIASRIGDHVAPRRNHFRWGAIRSRVREGTCGIGVFLPRGADIAGIYGEGTPAKVLISLVGVRGFEPPTPASRRQCSTRLSYTPCIRRAGWEAAASVAAARSELGEAGQGIAVG